MDRFDFSYSPYEILSSAEQATLQASVDMVFFDDEALIIEAGQPVQFLYVVIKGLVREVNPAGEVVAIYHSRDTFEARALIDGSSPNRYIVSEQALLYTIPKATVTELISSNPRFGAYFYSSVADKLSNMMRSKSVREAEGLITAKVRDAFRTKATWLPSSETILHAAQIMKSKKIKSILVRHDERVGLFTESVLRDVVIAGTPSSETIHAWTQFDLISCDIEDYVFNALLLMTQRKIQRVIVTENGAPVGALEQIDVLAYFSNHTHLIAQRLERAVDIEELADIADQMTQSIQILRNNGMRARQLAQLTQVLNTSLFEKAWRIVAPAGLIEQSCLLVMGSEGRGEQILKTDQDNALIMKDSVDLALAQRTCEEFSRTLTRLGYPPCNGQIMVNNAEWRKTVSEFRQTVFQWCFEPESDSMMKLAIFVDAKAVAGDESILTEIKEHLNRLLTDDAGRLGQFARAINLFDSQNQGFFSQILHRDHGGQMDIKKMGIFPVVHGIRSMSLEARLDETNTFERINRLAQSGMLDPGLAKDLSESLAFMMDLRLDAGLSNTGVVSFGSNHNQVDMQSLTTLDRDLLKVALQVVKRFKLKIAQHFHLGSF